MNGNLSDTELGDIICRKYSIDPINREGYSDKKFIGFIAKIAICEKSRDSFRGLIKELKFKYPCRDKKYRFSKLIERILRPRNGIYTYIDTEKLVKNIKDKYGLDHHSYSLNHINYYGSNVDRYIKAVQAQRSDYLKIATNRTPICACCQKRMQQNIDKQKKSSTCSKRCKDVLKTYFNLGLNRYRGESVLQKYLSFVISQTQRKQRKKTKGKFTWSLKNE